MENASRSTKQFIVNVFTLPRNYVRELVSTVANWLDRHENYLLLFLAVLYGFSTYIGAAGKLLWHDELFTFWIAQAPTWREMLHLTRTLDWNPPLLYSLARWSMHLLGAGALQVRLPSMLAYAGCAYCIFLCVKKWTASAAWGFVGLLIFFAQDTAYLSFEARPYALTMCFILWGIYLYEEVSDHELTGQRSHAALIGLAISGFLCMLSHVFALLPWSCLLLVEFLHSLRTKRVHLAKWVALLSPFVVTPLYRPIFADHGISVFPPAFQPTWFTAVSFYANELNYTLAIPALVLAVLLIGPEILGYRKLPGFRLESALLILGLLLAPCLLILYLAHSRGAFWPRYGFCLSLGFALALPVVSYCVVRGNRSVATVLVVVLLLASGQLVTVVSTIHHHRGIAVAVPAPCGACEAAQRLDPTLPFVDASGLDYVEMNAREPNGRLANLYYVYDLALGIKYAHATIFEGMPYEKESFHFRSQVAQYDEFVQQHQRFFVYGDVSYPEQWLLRKLLADGADVQLAGVFPSDEYFSKYLWKIQVKPSTKGH